MYDALQSIVCNIVHMILKYVELLVATLKTIGTIYECKKTVKRQ